MGCLGKASLSRTAEDQEEFAEHPEQTVCERTDSHQVKCAGAMKHSEWWGVKDKARNGGRSG